jgi:hypothetical protein
VWNDGNANNVLEIRDLSVSYGKVEASATPA